MTECAGDMRGDEEGEGIAFFCIYLAFFFWSFLLFTLVLICSFKALSIELVTLHFLYECFPKTGLCDNMEM
jgi:hypothetical protein